MTRAIYILGLIIACALGFLISRLSSDTIQYTASITLADITDLIITSAVTIFAAWYLSKKINEDRFAKELVIGDLRDIEQNIASVVNKIHGSQPSSPGQDEIINQLMPLVNQLHPLLKRFERTCAVNGKKVQTEKIMNSFRGFYGCATNFGDNPIDLSMVISYGDDMIVNIRATIADINKM